MASNIWYISKQIGYHDSKIINHKRDLRELMGTVEIITDEMLKMSIMSERIHCQDSPEEGSLPMEEVYVTQPAFNHKDKKM